ncbi:MAG: nuclear transport factor 2 family protein [Burkholderiaceae bacterium]
MQKTKQNFANADVAEIAFYDAIARGDLEGLMALWADDDEIICVHPGAPRLVGHAAIRASWEAIFARGGVRISVRERHLLQTTMTATHNVIEEIANLDEGQDERHVLATNVFLKTPAGWRILLHHASVAPGPAPGNGAGSSTLH